MMSGNRLTVVYREEIEISEILPCIFQLTGRDNV